MLRASGQGTGTTWTAMQKFPTERVQNAQWRMATALRLGLAPDAGPRATCALRKGNDRDMCVLTGINENLWNPDAGQPPEHLIHAIQESRQILQTSSVLTSREGGAALDTEFAAGQDPELWDLEEHEAEEMADFEEAQSPRGLLVEATASRARKAATRIHR